MAACDRAGAFRPPPIRAVEGGAESPNRLVAFTRASNASDSVDAAVPNPRTEPEPVDPKNVLVVGEDEKSREQMRSCLVERRILCREATNARDALVVAIADPPDLLLFDLSLHESGLGLCRTVRATASLAELPIIVLSSHASENDRVLAFEAGVDDFIAKPFYPPELVARVAAVLRGFQVRRDRATSSSNPDGAIRIEPTGDRVIVEGRHIDLTPRELEILRALLDQSGRVVRRGQLIDQLFSGRPPHERAIDAHVKTIRRKLGPARSYLETVRGVGYRISESAVAPAGSTRRENEAG